VTVVAEKMDLHVPDDVRVYERALVLLELFATNSIGTGTSSTLGKQWRSHSWFCMLNRPNWRPGRIYSRILSVREGNHRVI
jgi:hypothetical protein